MPKGIYPRASRNESPVITAPATAAVVSQGGEVRKVAVSEMPNRQSANANVEAMRQTHGDEESTTERLFGDIAERDKLDETDPNRSAEVLQTPIPVAQNPEEAQQERFQQEPPAPAEVQPEAEQPKAAEQPPDEFLDWEKLSGKKIRQKIDGKEVITTVEELRKFSDQDQIKKHLAEAADKVGKERRELAEERLRIQELRQQRTPQYEVPLANGQPQGVQTSEPDPVLQRLQFLEARTNQLAEENRQLAQGIQPITYQSNRQRVSDELKGQGFPDFLDYLPKMEAHMTSVSSPQLAGFYDTPEGAKALYFQLKAQDMQRSPASVTHGNVPRGTVDPQMNRNPVPPAAQIDGGSPASGHMNDDAGVTYRAAFRKARVLGDDKEAWNEVLRQKGILPD